MRHISVPRRSRGFMANALACALLSPVLIPANAEPTPATAVSLQPASVGRLIDGVPRPPLPPAGAVAAPRPISVARVDPALVAAYASRYGVTAREAKRRLTVQRAAFDIDDTLRRRFGDRHGGLYFDNATGQLVVAVLDDTAAVAARQVASRQGLAVWEMRATRVSRGLGDLHRAQMTVDAAMRRSFEARQVETGIDVRRNSVVIRIVQNATSDVEAEVAAAATRPGLVVDRVPPETLQAQSLSCAYPACSTPLRGGVVMATATNGSCSTGYIGHTATEWVLFGAGHCARIREPWSSYNSATRTWRRIGTPGPWYYNWRGDAGIWWTGRSDCGWCGSTTAIVAAWRFMEEYPIRGRAWSFQGMFACRLGARTDNRCGTVLETNVTTTYRDGTTLAGMFVMDACAEEGDSGGPLPSNWVAVGITSGGNTCGNATPRTWYEEVVDAEAALGAWVHTQ